MMDITRRSPWSKKTFTVRIDVREDEYSAWQGGMLIQEAMPRTCESEREFIKTGLTPGDWIDMFKDDFVEETT
tara:strand:+ start:750 stop:968 length:219 start_codon:yes stop_codon:yes gene_type:complete